MYPVATAAVDLNIEPGEIAEVIRKGGAGKAPGRDGITWEMLQAAPPEIYQHLADKMNDILAQRAPWPTAWQIYDTCMLPKVKAANTGNLLRPIALLSVTYKIYCGVLVRRARAAMRESMREGCFGFRPTYQAAETIHTLSRAVHIAQATGQQIYNCSFDIKAAYDMVSHPILFNKLREQLGVPLAVGLTRGLVEAFTVANYAGAQTGPEPLRRGLKQGRTSSPHLWNCYIEQTSPSWRRSGQRRGSASSSRSRGATWTGRRRTRRRATGSWPATTPTTSSSGRRTWRSSSR